jgi:hypothetical protein
MANEVVSAGSGPAQGLEIQKLKSELIALRRAASSRSAPDPRINQRISILEDEIAKKQTGMLGMAKGGSVNKKPVWEKARPKDLGKSKALSPKQKTAAKAMASKADRPYPNLVDNMRAAKMATGGLSSGKQSPAGLTKKQTAKVGKVMGEFKDKSLHSGKGGKVVKSPKQAIAIALSEASRMKKK